MLGNNWWQKSAKKLLASTLAMLLGLGLTGCGGGSNVRNTSPSPDQSAKLAGRIAEVAPPETIQTLNQALVAYQPQVRILSPQANEVIKDDRVTVYFQVKDLPLFKNEDLELGPHLHVFLDNQPYQAVYDPGEGLVLENLTPGTHTIRAFASRPWHESFKNEGAFAQTTFYVFAKTPDNLPDPNQPLLTYSRPQGSYGAEPVMLDFYLTNAPLHLVAQEDEVDNIKDWKIRCTVNGESFLFDDWEPIYLKGLKPGRNWVQLELLDEDGKAIANAFNNTVRIINYEPNGSDTLSKLVRGDLSADAARGIIDRNYKPAPPEPEETQELETQEPEVQEPEEAPAASEPEVTPEPSPSHVPEITPLPEVSPEIVPPTESPSSPEPEAPKQVFPAPISAPAEVKEELEAEVKDELEKIDEPPAVDTNIDDSNIDDSNVTVPPALESESEEPLTTKESPAEELETAQPAAEGPAVELTPTPAPNGEEPDTIAPAPQPAVQPPKAKGFFNRFRDRLQRPAAKPPRQIPAAAPEEPLLKEPLPEVIEIPVDETPLETLEADQKARDDFHQFDE